MKILPSRSSISLRQRAFSKSRLLILMLMVIMLVMKIWNKGDSVIDDYSCESCELEYENDIGLANGDNGDNGDISPADLTFDGYKTVETNIENIHHPAKYQPPELQPLKNPKKKYSFTVVSGASKNHFCPIESWIYTMNKMLKGLNVRIVVYDLGFTKKQRSKLSKFIKRGYITEFRTFNFTAYPSFWNISEARGEYGWKPAIVAEVARDYPGTVIWLDSGTLPAREYFINVPRLLKKYKGFVSPRSSGKMERWTHPGVYEYYGDDHSKYDKYYNCNGASLTFDTYQAGELIDAWYRCSLDKNCIAPPGSSRRNHRQDQSVLTYLAARDGRLCTVPYRRFWMKTHQDIYCKSIVHAYTRET